MQEECVAGKLTKKDFVSDQQLKWCPGCGDNSILRAVQSSLPLLDKKKEDFVFISGIGCSSRFPYYMNTYGFHTIHGRAAAVATGVKLANPDLSVWEVTGDGDALAIGGNHFIHAIRRNVDFNILLFNNQIYGLTKGQYSPTSQLGAVTKTSPYGTIEQPFLPGELAIGANCTFFARVIDTNPKLMTAVCCQAEKHEGTSLIEILQNCVIFNDEVYSPITSSEHKEDAQLILEHGKPMIFGKDKNKGIRLNGIDLEVVTLGENGISADDILIHDAHRKNPALHLMLIRMTVPEFPIAVGVIRDVEAPSYNRRMVEQINEVKANSKYKSLDDLFFSGDTWEIKGG